MHRNDELQYAIALGMIPGVGPYLARQLMLHYGSASQVLKQDVRNLKKVKGVGPKTAHSIAQFFSPDLFRKAARELEFCEEHQVSILLFSDPEFPPKLSHCPDAPYLLFMKGRLPLTGRRIVSVVGSRMATNYGKKLTESLVEGLASDGIVIVSGLALGIDSFAHRAALDQGLATAAVLAHGLGTIYPHRNTKLAGQILESDGALLTEYGYSAGPERMHFPARNRIVAGLADAVVVIESGGSGGALITAELANSYDREVFAFPGRIGDRLSEGCHRLIRENRAALIRSAEDVLEWMAWDRMPQLTAKPTIAPAGLTPAEQTIYQYISQAGDRVALESILEDCTQDGQSVRSLLLGLELKGAIRTYPGNTFAKA
jgi:DNA processing protein